MVLSYDKHYGNLNVTCGLSHYLLVSTDMVDRTSDNSLQECLANLTQSRMTRYHAAIHSKL